MQRERRWLVIVEDGRHVTVLGRAEPGRESDPSPEELDAAAAALDSDGLAGWLVVSDGDYWSSDPMDLMMVRRLTQREGSWDAARGAWMDARRQANA